MKRYFQIIMIILMGAVLFLSGCQLANGSFSWRLLTEKNTDPVTVIRLATDLTAESVGYGQLVDFSAQVSELSAGKMEIKLYERGAWSEDDSLLDYLTLGTLEMVVLSTTYLTKLVPAYEIFDLPYLFYDETALSNYATGVYSRRALEALDDVEFCGVGFVGNGYYYFLQSKGKLGESGNWSGLLMRGPQRMLYQQGLNYIGVTLVDENSVNSAFNSRMVDEATVKKLIAQQVIDENVCLNDVEMFYQLEIALCHQSWWENLTIEEQTILKEAMVDTLIDHLYQQKNSILAERFPEGGVTLDALSATQKTNLYYASRSVFERYLNENSNPLAQGWLSSSIAN